MPREPNRRPFPGALLLWALRIVAAAALAAGGSAGLCLAAQSTGFIAKELVCGHNVVLTLVPLFFGLWALLELVHHQLKRRQHLSVTAINSVTSAVGLALLIGMVSAAAFLFSLGRHFWVTAIAGYLFTVPFAIAAWNGALWRHTETGTQAPASWRDWVGIFFVGLAVSMLFVALDVAVAHPGFSLALTIATVSLTFIALPSALRAWLVELLSHRYGNIDR